MEDSKERTKVQNDMGMRNKRIFLFTICYNHVVSKLRATQRQRKKMKFISLASKELSRL